MTATVEPSTRFGIHRAWWVAAVTMAGLVAAAEIAARNGADADAIRYRASADDMRSRLDAWTVTTSGPLSADPYFLRLSVDGDADAGTTYELADGGPIIDQRAVVDPVGAQDGDR